jgi:cytoskeletal protein CcmA (bactofilin family)
MNEGRTTREGSQGRGSIITAGLAAALVLTSLLCALAFAESASRSPQTPSGGPPPSSPPAASPPPASAGAGHEGDASSAGDEESEEERTPETPGESITQLVAKDYMVAPNDTAEGDRYFVGSNTDIEGTIEGDFFAFSKGISIPGRVSGDVNSLANNISISGNVDDDARVLAQELMVRGKVAGDLIALAGEIDVVKGAKVGGRTLAFASNVTLDGEFRQAMNVGGGVVNFGGHAFSNVKVESDALTFTDDARIDGNLTYTAREELSSLTGERAKRLVGGHITFVPKKPAEKKSILTRLVWTVWTFIATFIIGSILILVAYRLVRTILATARVETLKSFGFGILGHILVPFVGLILVCICLGLGLATCVTSGGKLPALPLAFLPPGLLVLAAWSVFFYLAKFVVAAALGDTILRRLGRDPSPYMALFVGMVPMWILVSIPILGSFLYFIVIPVFGIGAMLVGLRAHFEKDGASSLADPARTAV